MPGRTGNNLLPETKKEREKEKERGRETGRERGREAERETERQAERGRERQRGRERGREAEREGERKWRTQRQACHITAATQEAPPWSQTQVTQQFLFKAIWRRGERETDRQYLRVSFTSPLMRGNREMSSAVAMVPSPRVRVTSW